jgi:NADH:ubiquinone oxidoreductase subunit 3 (subunit A)
MFFLLSNIFQYKNFLFYLILILILCFGIGLISFFLNFRNFYSEKVTVYECGFNPFDDSRRTFDIKFYLISIVFIVFDVEVILLFPLIGSMLFLSYFSFCLVLFFLLVLVIGLIYEWLLGVSDLYT